MIILDVDFIQPQIGNLVIISPQWQVVKGCNINLACNFIPPFKKAQNGYYNGDNGCNGKGGKQGNPGRNFYAFFQEIVNPLHL